MSAQHFTEKDYVLVTAADPKTGDSDTQQIWDDYCLVAVGSAKVANIQVHRKGDGTATHVVTIKGVRRG